MTATSESNNTNNISAMHEEALVALAARATMAPYRICAAERADALTSVTATAWLGRAMDCEYGTEAVR